jgi:hypothetical protein
LLQRSGEQQQRHQGREAAQLPGAAPPVPHSFFCVLSDTTTDFLFLDEVGAEEVQPVLYRQFSGKHGNNAQHALPSRFCSVGCYKPTL